METCGRRWSWSWLSLASEASCLRGTWHVLRRRSTFPRRRPCPPWRKKEGESSWKRTKGTACFPSRGGLPKWAVGNFSSFFFSFLPSSHGFRDEAYGGEGRMKIRFSFLEWRHNCVLTFSGGLVRVMGRLFCGCGSWDEWVWKERGWVRSFEKEGWLIIGRCCLGFWIFWGREFVFLEKMWKDEEIYVYIYVIRLFHGVWISRWWIVQGGLIRRFGGSFQFWEEYWLAWLLKLSILFW